MVARGTSTISDQLGINQVPWIDEHPKMGIVKSNRSLHSILQNTKKCYNLGAFSGVSLCEAVSLINKQNPSPAVLDLLPGHFGGLSYALLEQRSSVPPTYWLPDEDWAPKTASTEGVLVAHYWLEQSTIHIVLKPNDVSLC
ncbi:hypothetical protein Bbelb_425280 [Branchiostoma belcheri]|nr:hypothetical protein Bbelb_425280 [Branchiostoma belcheri]